MIKIRGGSFKSALAWKDTSVGINWFLMKEQECKMRKQSCATCRDSKLQVSRSKSSARLEAKGSQMETLPIVGLVFHQGPYIN